MHRRVSLSRWFGLKLVGLMLVVLVMSHCATQSQDAIIGSYELPLSWPLSPLTEEQIAEVRQCDCERLSVERYPPELEMGSLFSVYEPELACDWAVLAVAYAERIGQGESLPDVAVQAFSQAIGRNSGFALATPVFNRYFDRVPLVDAPPFSNGEITVVEIDYEWNDYGLGVQRIRYSVEITQADVAPLAFVTVVSDTLGVSEASLVSSELEVDIELIQALGSALTDLVPVETQFILKPCFDHNPDWSVRLEFADDTTLNLVTNESNYLFAGGPWQTEINGQSYVQFSTAFLRALLDLTDSLELPLGEPGMWSCYPETVFDKAFP